MNLSPTQAQAARQALSKVVERAQQALQANDTDAALQHLMATRDACIGAAITIRAVADEARERARRERNAA